jgi:hypothetical protein
MPSMPSMPHSKKKRENANLPPAAIIMLLQNVSSVAHRKIPKQVLDVRKAWKDLTSGPHFQGPGRQELRTIAPASRVFSYNIIELSRVHEHLKRDLR